MLHPLAIVVAVGLWTAVSSSAQSRRLKDDDVKRLMEETKKDVERFTDAVDSKFRTAKIRTTTSEVAVDGYLKDLKNRAEAMRDRFKEDYAASREVLSFLQQANAIERRSASGGTLFGAEKEWPRLRGTLGRLSQVYGVDWNASPESWSARRMNDRELVKAIETYSKGTESFKKSLEEALKHVSEVGKEERKAVISAVDRLPNVADDLKGAVEDGKDTSGELGLLKSATDEIQKFLEKHGLSNAVGSTFRTLGSDLSAITAATR
jgi:ferritin-like metal-binding protein YciE